MANSAQHNNYYSNPAFCQQSEFYNNYSRQLCRTPKKTFNSNKNCVRESPVGAQSPTRVVDIPPKLGPKPKPSNDNENYLEQDFYEEIFVDDSGFVKQKKIVVVHSSNDNGPRYACTPQNDNGEVLYEGSPERKYQKSKYEYLQKMQRQDANNHNQPSSKTRYEEEIELGNRRIHRYAVIPCEEESEIMENKNTYDDCPKLPQQNRYLISQNRRYEYIDSIVDDQSYNIPRRNHQKEQQIIKRVTSPIVNRRMPNHYATQKLHELLATPPKSFQTPQHPQTPKQITSPNSMRKPIRSPSSVTPKKISRETTPRRTPKAQQKLNYALSTRQLENQDKRSTAIVAPICSSPVQSVYSETTFSNKSESWMNISGHKQPVQATLTVAAVMMLLCGGLTSCLCFYMVSVMGRLYFLDFGIVSGFACLVLGALGCRSRHHYYWLPNRNYMSGYIILTLFSLLTCVGLLILLFMQPKPGSPLADMTSGAVCGISVLSLILATAGVITSYCCKLPPPDNRVEHCARGFTV